jgi:hypothetical protein
VEPISCRETKINLMAMKDEANRQQREMEELIEEIAANVGFDVANINSVS